MVSWMAIPLIFFPLEYVVLFAYMYCIPLRSPSLIIYLHPSFSVSYRFIETVLIKKKDCADRTCMCVHVRAAFMKHKNDSFFRLGFSKIQSNIEWEKSNSSNLFQCQHKTQSRRYWYHFWLLFLLLLLLVSLLQIPIYGVYIWLFIFHSMSFYAHLNSAWSYSLFIFVLFGVVVGGGVSSISHSHSHSSLVLLTCYFPHTFQVIRTVNIPMVHLNKSFYTVWIYLFFRQSDRQQQQQQSRPGKHTHTHTKEPSEKQKYSVEYTQTTNNRLFELFESGKKGYTVMINTTSNNMTPYLGLFFSSFFSSVPSRNTKAKIRTI